jgi:hypothetical protein
LKIRDALFFSPKYRFADLDFSKKEVIIEAFRDRIDGYYLASAKALLAQNRAFAAGLITCAAIDALAVYTIGGRSVHDRFVTWLKRNIPELNEEDEGDPPKVLAERFYEDIRNGLVHECKLMNFVQFDLEQENLLSFDGPVLMVNPRLLLESVEVAFERHCKSLQENPEDYRNVSRLIYKNFHRELTS